jgi:four helix bundle protein
MKAKENTTKDKRTKFDLQDRFIDYAVRIIKLSEKLPETKAGRHICSQILRSGTSPAPNYGEAQSAESKADFIHKLKISLKELRETEVWLKIIIRAELIQPSKLSSLLLETDELISILFTSIETAKKQKER